MQQGKEPGMLLEGLVPTAGITIYSLAVSGVLRIMISAGCSAQFYSIYLFLIVMQSITYFGQAKQHKNAIITFS